MSYDTGMFEHDVRLYAARVNRGTDADIAEVLRRVANDFDPEVNTDE